jgi:hypothetical protein
MYEMMIGGVLCFLIGFLFNLILNNKIGIINTETLKTQQLKRENQKLKEEVKKCKISY